MNKTLKQTTTIGLFFLFFFGCHYIISGQAALGNPASAPDTPSIFDLLVSEKPLKIELETDIDSLLNNRRNEESVPGMLRFRDAEKRDQHWNIDVEIRGKYRRMVCSFPPLKIDFSKEELKAQGLQEFDDLKLVTHCLDNEQGEFNVLKEYLVYRLYQILTDKSFRVQLARITYRDKNGKRKTRRYGILLEDENDLAHRLNSELCEDCLNQPVESFNKENFELQALFQFMIGNTDWSIEHLRNLKYLAPQNGGKPVLVPFDFDFSGLVNASYAVPDPNYGFKHIRQRKFLGIAKTMEEIQPTIDLFLEKKEALLGFTKNFKYLPFEQRFDIEDYLKTFYQCIDKGILFENIVNFPIGE